jgi:phenylpropionate dioxygenase-like ring-hydroxylating dioxygenase large terminal subunit
MPFARNCWYMFGWTHEFTPDELLARRVAGLAVVAYRNRNGEVIAFEDRCCHRHAPLSRGALEGDGLRCGYHGLKFGDDGRCIDIPGQDRIPETLRVRKYPTYEHKDMVFVWLGNQDAIEDAELPDFYWHDSDDWCGRPRLTHAKANYELIVDNILDFSHLAWLHGDSFGTPSASSAKGQVTRDGDDIRLRYIYEATPITPFHQKLTGYEGKVDREHVISWRYPGIVWVENRYWAAGNRDARPIFEVRSTHFLTPETESTTNYFWTHANRADCGSDEQMDLTYEVVTHAFQGEDLPMIEAQQTNIDPETRMRAVYWDEAPALARQITARNIEAG